MLQDAGARFAKPAFGLDAEERFLVQLCDNDGHEMLRCSRG
jgi:hypothetical protein